MRKVTGFLFTHFDSRGGSTFVAGKDEHEAAAKYGKAMWDYESPRDDDQLEGLKSEDLVGRAVLIVPDNFSPKFWDGKDLEGEGEIPGKVIIEGDSTWETINSDDPGVDSANGDFYNFHGDKEIVVEFVPAGAAPQFINPAHCCSPRWDDDAFSFQFIA